MQTEEPGDRGNLNFLPSQLPSPHSRHEEGNINFGLRSSRLRRVHLHSHLRLHRPRLGTEVAICTPQHPADLAGLWPGHWHTGAGFWPHQWCPHQPRCDHRLLRWESDLLPPNALLCDCSAGRGHRWGWHPLRCDTSQYPWQPGHQFGKSPTWR